MTGSAGRDESVVTDQAGRAELAGVLPGGPRFDVDITRDVIVLRVGDGICIAAPTWLNVDQAARVAASLTRLTKETT